MKQALAYIRVSTARQGASGFGYAAQLAQIKNFARQAGYTIEAEYLEQASAAGPRDYERRPQLQAAVLEARSGGIPLIVADVDRLTRWGDTARRLLSLPGLQIIAASLGSDVADSVFIGRVARCQHESEALRRSTTEALAQIKRAGKPLGNKTNLKEAQIKGARSNARKGLERTAAMRPAFEEARKSGARTAKQIADYLNDRGVLTARGLPWTIENVHRVLKKVKAQAMRTEGATCSSDGVLTVRGAARLRKLSALRGPQLDSQLAKLGHPPVLSVFANARAGEPMVAELRRLVAAARQWPSVFTGAMAA